MTSKERREARYQRRKIKRGQSRTPDVKYDDLFTFERLYSAFYKCRKGVRWKRSVQSYEATQLLATLDVYGMMKQRHFKVEKFLEFNINERGKKRHIRANTLKERCIQKVLCDHYLTPLLQKRLIYDNSASTEGKGPTFAIKRLTQHLGQYYRKYHTNHGYIFQYDFSKFFDNIDHQILLNSLREYIKDPEIFEVIRKIIANFGDKGLGLGSQTSQICAIFYPNLVDKMFKEKIRKRWYGRYM